ncbi:MAG: hypothetical protein V7K50_07110 [Nostoc sp.]|uniref:hypothetical protein n=1 Tax=Nostoc sp. TaxID=1180 RepID=UPI002FF637CC
MTQYSIPTETPLQNGFTLTTDDRQPEVESLDWESQMSRLVGFEEESSSATNPQGSEDSATPQESISQPQEVQTQQPLSSNPFAKLALVGAATLAVVLVGGVFLSRLMSTSNEKPKTIVSPEVRSQPTDQSSSQQLEGEVDTLKTKLALTEQAQLVKAAQQQLRIAKSTPTVALQKPLVSSIDRQNVIPTPAPTVYVPQPVAAAPIVKAPAYQPLPSPQLPVVNPNTQPVVNTTPPSPPSPIEEWMRLSKLGSYGQVNASTQPIAAASEPVNNTQEQTPNPNPSPTPQQPAPVVSQAQPQGQKCLAVGSSAKGVLATAIFGESSKGGGGGGGDADENKNVFVIRLQEPLKCKDGTIALPANTEFLTEIRSLSDQGLLQMNVIKVISQNNGNPTEQTLPNNAIILRGTQGKPLIANKFPSQSSSIASMDAGQFLVGGLSKAAELINRPDTTLVSLPTTTTTTNADGTTSPVTTSTTGTITENRRNLGAAVVEGGLNSLGNQIAQRNQQAIAQMSQQNNVWFLPAGTNIEIYVNQPTQL